MKNLLESLDQYLNSNPVSRLIYNYFNTEFPQGWSRESGHAHNSMEIVCCVNGSAYYVIDDMPRPIVLNKYDLLILYPGTYHTMYTSQNIKSKCTCVQINATLRNSDKLLSAFSETFFKGDIYVKLNADDTIISCIKGISHEMENRQHHYDKVIKSEIIRLAILLSRVADNTEDPSSLSNNYVADALAYIQQNISQTITPADIAEIIFISPEYLMRLFKKSLGKSVMKVILELRMSRGKFLLSNTSLKISRVADECGYINVQHFSMVFKKFTGESPSSYRKSAQSMSMFPQMTDVDKNSFNAVK